MRKIIILLFITLVTQSVFSQDIEKCKEVIKIITKSINSKSATTLEKHLAADFEIAGQKGTIAKMVLTQLLSQLDETVLKSEEISIDNKPNELVMLYKISYQKMGDKEATFVFNEHNKLKSMKLFEMIVKTLKNDSKITFPDSQVITVPFKKVGNLILVEVLVNNEKKMFLLDSGSPRVIINSYYLPQTTNKTLSSTQGVNGNISGVNITEVNSLNFSGIKMEKQEILTMDISHLEKSLNSDFEIYGLIGYELIKEYDLLFDYQNSKVILIKADYFEQYNKEYLSNSKLDIVPFTLSSHIPVFKANIGGKYYTFGLDCGAESNLIDSDLLEELSKSIRKRMTSTLRGADKKGKEVTKGFIKKTIIGKCKFKNMETVFSSISHLNDGYKINIDGLMGYELLSKQKTLISYKRKELVFIK